MTAVLTEFTADDLLHSDGKGYELIDGKLKELEVSRESSWIAGQIFYALESFNRSARLGWVFPEGTSYRCFPNDPSRICRPDTSFIQLSRMTPEQFHEGGHCPFVPDLVVEVVSPNDIAEEVEAKIEDWLGAGVNVVWEVYPTTRVIRAYRPDYTVTVFRGHDTLTAPDVLPGFACRLADLFQLPGESPRSDER